MPKPGFLLRDRSARALLLAALAIGGYGLLRPVDVTGLPPSEFWAEKMAWRACADLVLAGDSRTYVGVAPEGMRESRPGRRVLNFGFDNGAFTGAYLDAVERILDPASPHRTVVLGITPHALTLDAARDNWFERLRRTGAPRPHPLKLKLSRLLDRFSEPVPPEKAFLLLFDPESAPRHRREYRADGWMASRLTPEMPGKGLEVASGWFREGGVDEGMVAALIDRVERWTASRIRVCAFRPPIAPELAAFEDRAGRFDAAAFRKRFEAAGGLWVAIAPEAYRTYDGSHLDRDSALDLGRQLARLLPLGQ
jgi:hypothetical protein